jgi:SagB-type dehydrogenase family enzyme
MPEYRRYLCNPTEEELGSAESDQSMGIAAPPCRSRFPMERSASTFRPSTRSAVFIRTAIPYRTEWRYGTDSLKYILIGAGHVCQNLYLACEALGAGAGACVILSYDQSAMDRYLGVDGEDEMSIYCATVGKR